MLSGLATAVVTMLSALLPIITGGASTEIDSIINVLIQLIPAVVQEVEQLGPIFTNIITALKGSTAITQAQLAQLATVETQYDAAFEAAATAAGAPPATS
jgi:phage-related protein